MKLIERKMVWRGSAWGSRHGWFWISFNGEIYSFTIKFGRLDVTFEKKDL